MTVDVRVDTVAPAPPSTTGEAAGRPTPGTRTGTPAPLDGKPNRSPDRPGTGSGRLRHEPALDGLRGLAIAVVVVFHLGHLPGGFLGVDLFFVLSGFLITSLLVAERDRTGAVGLGGFWARRARRLLPALFALLVGVGALLLSLTPEGQRNAFRDDALATLGYVANWQRLFADIGYWDMFIQPSPLDHMWSLAIEEQFYLLWPLVAVAVLGRRRARSPRLLGGVALGGAVVSFALLAATYDPADTNRAYFGTDTRIGPTLLGAALAAFTHHRRTSTADTGAGAGAGTGATARRRPRPSGTSVLLATWLGLAALAVMVWSLVELDGLAPGYYRGGLLAFALAATAVVHVVTGRHGSGGPVAAALSWAPLRGLGAVSYGVYLWHWPVIVYLTPERVPVDGLALDALRVLVTLGVALLSFVLVEQPIRRGGFAPGRLRVVGAGAAAVALASVVLATGGKALPPPTTEVPPDDLAGAFDPANEWSALHRHLPVDVPAGTPKLLLVGDSGVAKLGPALVEAGEAAGVAVGFSSEGFCSVVWADDVSLAEGVALWERPLHCPEDRRTIWREMVRRFDPDVVVHYLANGGTLFKEHLDGEWVWDCDEPYDAYLRTHLRDDLELLGSGGARVVFTTTPYVPEGVPRRSPSSDERIDCRNDTYREVVAGDPAAALLDLNAFVEEQRAASGEDLFVDEVHLDEAGVALVNPWLLARTTPEALDDLFGDRPG